MQYYTYNSFIIALASLMSFEKNYPTPVYEMPRGKFRNYFRIYQQERSTFYKPIEIAIRFDGTFPSFLDLDAKFPYQYGRIQTQKGILTSAFDEFCHRNRVHCPLLSRTFSEGRPLPALLYPHDNELMSRYCRTRSTLYRIRKSDERARERGRKSQRRVWIFNDGLAPVSRAVGSKYPLRCIQTVSISVIPQD